MAILDGTQGHCRFVIAALLVVTATASSVSAATSSDPCCVALASVHDAFQRVAQVTDAAAGGDAVAARDGIAALVNLPALLEPTAACAADADAHIHGAIDDTRQLADHLDRGAILLAKPDPWPQYREAHAAAIQRLQEVRADLAAARRVRGPADDATAVASALDDLDAQITWLESQLPGLIDADTRITVRSGLAVRAAVAELRETRSLLEAQVIGTATREIAQTPVADVESLTAAAAALEQVMDSARDVELMVGHWAMIGSMLRRSSIAIWLELDRDLGGRCTGP